MKKNIFLLFLCSFVLSELIAQNILPPVYEIKSDTIDFQQLGTNYWQILTDKDGKYTIDQVSVSNRFHDATLKIDDTLAKAYWIRYSLKNAMTTEAGIALYSLSDYDDFYFSQPDGKWKHLVSGKKYNWNKKDGLKKADCIPFPIKPGAQVLVYQRVANDAYGLKPDFAVFILSTAKIIQQYYVSPLENINNRLNIFSFNQLKDMFIIGFLVFAGFFNLFFFAVVRERIYLYFSLFLFFLSLNRCFDTSYRYLSEMKPEALHYVSYLYIAWAFIQFFLIHFMRYFFKTFEYYKKWDRFLYFQSFLWALVIFLKNIIPTFPGGMNKAFLFLNSCALLSVFLSLLITLFLFVPKLKTAKFIRLMIIAAFPFVVWYTICLSCEIITKISSNTFFISLYQWIQTHFRTIEIICMSWFVLFSSRILFLRYSQLQKNNVQQLVEKQKILREKELERTQLIEQQKELLEKQVEERTSDLKQSIVELKSTQSQLIQSEKMASLGELTAGIAHEIQNPLNFVNNFSEVNAELLTEMKDELDKGNIDDAKIIANDAIENQQKILHHGKRADAIVKGMLQHSRSGGGKKEPTDINKLADEYLRLAYHGLRAKDKSFNATMKTDYDETIGNINIIPPDIGRVILNLITNAFYVVNEKTLSAVVTSTAVKYEPTVSIATKKIGNKVEIKVKDNGNGIQQKVLDKIFQPFFTTKPTGQGTGLGLSLSYDIVKAHGGELKVETKEGEGSEFIVELPLNK